ncbi:DinB family protein [Neolewinella xylanilytica]|uniref:DinB family protein n=1 Tax=Neolewinella xylanilytica TaxID=1514080 RepID=A0A2S6I229_9BACT|nr:DinB family protein [Neolewinella xylanilytica]PPK85141.1 DinB family protein [Neolewinella xylanilytica]
MKARSATELLDRLEQRLRQNITLAYALRELSDTALRKRPAPEAWCALEAVEHVNIWNADYLDRLAVALDRHGTSPAPTFASSRIGNFFVGSVKPGPKTRKIPTLKRLNPVHRDLDHAVLDNWLRQAELQERILRKARTADLNRIRIKTALTSLIKMRLGDVLRMMVYHDWRHLEQACRAAGVRVDRRVEA